MRSRIRSTGASAVVLILAASVAVLAQTSSPLGSTKPTRTARPIAVVGTQPISRDEFERRVAQAAVEFRERNGADIPSEMTSRFRRQVLEGAIRFELLALEAQRQHLTATVEQADEILKKNVFFNPAGHFDAGKFASVKQLNSPTYQQAIAGIRIQLAARMLEQKLERERSPSDSLLRDVARRSLGHAALDYVAVELRSFDGQYPEPREIDVLKDYRAHLAEYRRPETALLSIIFVDRPVLPESLRGVPSEVQSWNGRLRQRADSALSALKEGAAFKNVAAIYGSIRTAVPVTPERFPDFWRGARETQDAIFRARPGGFLDQPVPSNPGFLVVRVDSLIPAGFTPLREASLVIRRRLRAEARQNRDDRELRSLFTQMADSLRGPAVRVRYATADTASMDPGPPSEADLDRYYRGHLADYSSFDTRSGTIRSLPLADVRDDVRLRWMHEARAQLAQAVAEGLQRAWSAGKRDPALEKSATLLRDIGPLPVGAPVDTGLAARLVADSINARGAIQQVGLESYARGFLVYDVYEAVPLYRPTFEQARGRLASAAARQRDAADRIGARALYDRDPRAWVKGDALHFSRIMFPFPRQISVPLSKQEVERYYRAHAESYGAPEVVHARHILISPTGPGPAADRIALARADSLLGVLRSGTEFTSLARRVTDDPATREHGGDLGTFGRGVMLDAFERVAFELKPGETSSPVRTQEGYHIIQCVDHLPTYSQPLAWKYVNVGFDAATVKGDSLTFLRADSVYRRAHTPAEAREAAARMGLVIEPNQIIIGDRRIAPGVRPYLIGLEQVKPGHFYPGPFPIKGLGYYVTWVDSITPATAPIWENVEDEVLAAYRRGAASRIVQAKLAEMDSMLTAGWSLDSLGTLWGGPTRAADVIPSSGLSDVAASQSLLDSLVYGARGGRPLELGEISGWARVPSHVLKLRLGARFEPGSGAIAQRIEADRRASLDRTMRPYFDDLAHRYGVQILDSELRRMELPPPPPAPRGLP